MNRHTPDKTAADLIYLVSCAVNLEKPDRQRCDAMDLEKVCRLSQRHMLTSAAAFALGEIRELPRPFDQVMKKTIRKLALFDIERAKLSAALEEARIWYLPLKGVILKGLYPKSAMREMADNDILCDSSRMEDVRGIMERLGYSCIHYGVWNHDVYRKPPLEFEIHHELFGKDLLLLFSDYFADLKDRLIPCRGTSYGFRMSDEDFYIYLLCHIYKHYHYSGTGLRSLLDVYVFCKNRFEELDRAYLFAQLEKLELSAFEEDIRLLAMKLFTGQPLDEAQRRELCYFVNSGSYGSLEQRDYLHMQRRLGGSDSGRSKRAYLLRRVFLSGEKMKDRYPFVYRHKALYPLIWIARPVKGAVTRPGKILCEFREVKRFKKKTGFGSHNEQSE